MCMNKMVSLDVAQIRFDVLPAPTLVNVKAWERAIGFQFVEETEAQLE